MRALLTDSNGQVWLLPQLTQWVIQRTDGDPCDSAKIVFSDDAEHREALEQGTEITVEAEGKTYFTGLVDEIELSASESGRFVTVTARGFAAKMMRRQLRSNHYCPLTVGDAVRFFVTPCGVATEGLTALPRVEELKVTTGMTAWQAFCGFCRKSNGSQPYFTAKGLLTVKSGDRRVWALTAQSPIIALKRRVLPCKRMGQVIMVSPGGEIADIAQGSGASVTVSLLQNGAAANAKWRTAKQTVEETERASDLLEVTFASPVECEPGEWIATVLPDYGISGKFLVQSVVRKGSEQGETVTVTAEGVEA